MAARRARLISPQARLPLLRWLPGFLWPGFFVARLFRGQAFSGPGFSQPGFYASFMRPRAMRIARLWGTRLITRHGAEEAPIHG
jgi:hypothetical protein